MNSPPKILITGKNGQVGWELNRSFLPLGEVIALGREEADFSKPESLRKVVRDVSPDVIINAAAFTDVDKAESEEELATLVNGVAPGVLAEEAERSKALLIHYSTDYVFDGTKDAPYTEDDIPNPINAYGRSKLAGEQAIQESGAGHIILRTSWVYSARGHNYLRTILRLVREKEELVIVNDQIGAPTWARLIAETSAHCIRQAKAERQDGTFSSDLYHLASKGETSWYGFAEVIVNNAQRQGIITGSSCILNTLTTAEYPTPAKRPMNSRLATDKLTQRFSIATPGWDYALGLCMGDLG